MALEATHYLVSMQRGATQNSASPMWRCVCSTGEKVNVFLHNDPAKDNGRLFSAAGYLETMQAMELDQVMTWKNHPIPVVLSQDGKWLAVKFVFPRADGVDPDPVETINLVQYRLRSINWARVLLRQPVGAVAIVDVETTGLTADDEIIEIAALGLDGVALVQQLIRPLNPARLDMIGNNGLTASQVTGLTYDDLKDQPTFSEFITDLFPVLESRLWVGWNVAFDAGMIEQACVRGDCLMPTTLGLNDAMRYFSEWLGLWNPLKRSFPFEKLESACERLSITQAGAHEALNDCRDTLRVIQNLAVQEWQE